MLLVREQYSGGNVLTVHIFLAYTVQEYTTELLDVWSYIK